MYISSVTQRLFNNKDTQFSHSGERPSQIKNRNTSDIVTFKGKNIYELIIKDSPLYNEVDILYKNGIKYNEHLIAAIKKARADINDILTETGFDLIEISSTKRAYGINKVTVKLLESSSVNKTHKLCGPHGYSGDMIILSSKKHPDVELGFFEDMSNDYPIYDYNDKNFRFYGSNSWFNFNNDITLYLATPIRENGILLPISHNYRSNKWFNNIIVMGKNENYQHNNEFIYSIFDPKNGVDYVFKHDIKGVNNIVGIRNQNNNLIVEDANSIHQGQFAILKDNHRSLYYETNFIWTIKNGKIELTPNPNRK